MQPDEHWFQPLKERRRSLAHPRQKGIPQGTVVVISAGDSADYKIKRQESTASGSVLQPGDSACRRISIEHKSDSAPFQWWLNLWWRHLKATLGEDARWTKDSAGIEVLLWWRSCRNTEQSKGTEAKLWISNAMWLCTLTLDPITPAKVQRRVAQQGPTQVGPVSSDNSKSEFPFSCISAVSGSWAKLHSATVRLRKHCFIPNYCFEVGF